MKLIFKLLLASATILAHTASAQLIAEFKPASPFISALPGGTRLDGQTFTATISGTVGQVRVLAQSFGPAPSLVTFQLRSVSGGLPTSSILASVSVAGSGLSSSTLTDFFADFSSLGFSVTAGDMYALTLSASSSFALGGAADGYAGGAQVISSNSGSSFSTFAPARDLSFSVSLAPSAVPEPSTYSLAGAGLLVALAGISKWRRRAVKN